MQDPTEILVDSFTKTVEDFNAHCIYVEQLEDTVREQNAKLAESRDTIENLTSDLKAATQRISQAILIRAQTEDQLALSKASTKSYKELGTPKQIREKLKNYQTKAASATKDIASLRSTQTDLRNKNTRLLAEVKELQVSVTKSTLTALWSSGDEHLMLCPMPLTMQVKGMAQEQVPLLHLKNNGWGKLICLDSEDVALECLEPEDKSTSTAALDMAGRILRKSKANKWRLSHDEMMAFIDMGD